jgi:hypothetical protein
VYQIPDKVLALNDSYEVMSKDFTGFGFLSDAKIYPSRMIRLGNGDTTLFIKGVKVQDSQSIFSYDLGLNNITPDRIFADRDRVLDSIENLLKDYASPEAIKTVLSKAFSEPEGNYQEFQAFYNRKQDKGFGITEFEPLEYTFEFGKEGYGRIPRRPLTWEEKQQRKEAELELKAKTNSWALAFKEMFGENAVLESSDVNENRDAEIMGYKPIKVNSGVASHLKENGIKDVYGIVKEREYRWIEKAELTDSERGLVDKVDEINQVVLEEPTPVDVRVYQGLYTKAGREIESSYGVHVTEPSGQKYIGIRRDRLGSLEDFTETYIHELGHNITGAGDADRRFVDFFVNALAKLTRHQIQEKA